MSMAISSMGGASYSGSFSPANNPFPKNNLEAARKAFAKGLRPAKKKMTNLASAKNAINYPMHHVDSYGRKLPYGPYMKSYPTTGVSTAGFTGYDMHLKQHKRLVSLVERVSPALRKCIDSKL